MGKRGPKPTPTALLEKRGSWRGSVRKRAGEIVEAPTINLCPPDVRKEAKKHWNALVPKLEALGLMTDTFVISMILLCNSMQDYIELEKEIQLEGRYSENLITGVVALHPRCKAKDRAWEQIIKVCREFGLTPSSRAGLVSVVTANIKSKKATEDEDDGFKIV